MDTTKIMLDINDPNTLKIAEMLKNQTARKILNYLSSETASVSKTSKALKLKLNVVDYNVKKLKKAGLIEEKKHFWSDRGKRMPAYHVSNKEIVISPRSSFVKKTILPTGLVSLFGAGLIYITTKSRQLTSHAVPINDNLMLEAANSPIVRTGAEESAKLASTGEPLWAWFLFGAIVALIFVLIFKKMKGGLTK